MILYKKRDFGELITDSFQFFREYGKNYFKNYFIINGGILLLLLILVAVGFKDILGQIFGSNLNGESYFLEEYFAQNSVLLIVTGTLIFALFIILSLINYSYPVVYLDLLAKNSTKKDFTLNELLSALKAKTGKIIIFSLLGTIILLPLFGLAMGLSFVLIFLIIGIVLIMALIPIFLLITNFTLFEYLTTENTYFDSLGNAFKYLFSKNFWKYLGEIVVVYLIISAVSSVFTLAPAFLVGFRSAAMDRGDTLDNSLSLFVFAMYCVSIIVSFITSNLLYVNTGLMYYDSREDLQREVFLDEIDAIGKDA